ncbi:hypothetical protein COCON_G00132100 [Conger conger]|uniref:Uncharacterized protein n=1 Tax=Conger conger TaxID=82655 RepID=A0A9Q1DE53_CONCO|nr:hypothetical protein COCON_G00132100 [Conger conger]
MMILLQTSHDRGPPSREVLSPAGPTGEGTPAPFSGGWSSDWLPDRAKTSQTQALTRDRHIGAEVSSKPLFPTAP